MLIFKIIVKPNSQNKVFFESKQIGMQELITKKA